jgi:hypothetical protein
LARISGVPTSAVSVQASAESSGASLILVFILRSAIKVLLKMLRRYHCNIGTKRVTITCNWGLVAPGNYVRPSLVLSINQLRCKLVSFSEEGKCYGQGFYVVYGFIENL